MEALSYTQGSVKRARAIIAHEQARLPANDDRIDPEVRVWLASARGMAELAGGDIHVSRDQFGLAARLADTMPAQFDARTRNDFHQRHAFTLIRLGDGKGAEAEITPLLAAQTQLLGPTNPDVLLLRMNLGQAYLYQRRFSDAVETPTAVLPLMRRQLGPDHRLVQQTLAARVEAYGNLGDYRASIADGRELYAIALKQQGLHAFRPIVALSDLATSECRAPDLAQGVADAQGLSRFAGSVRRQSGADPGRRRRAGAMPDRSRAGRRRRAVDRAYRSQGGGGAGIRSQLGRKCRSGPSRDRCASAPMERRGGQPSCCGGGLCLAAIGCLSAPQVSGAECARRPFGRATRLIWRRTEGAAADRSHSVEVKGRGQDVASPFDTIV
jgi:hypothetical protein